MSSKEHYLLFAQYNQRMNQQLFQAVSSLSTATLSENKGLFFGSIIGSLNHILVGDLIWLKRFAKLSPRYQSLSNLSALPQPNGLDCILYHDLEALKVAREHVDRTLISWLTQETQPEDFMKSLKYSNTAGILSERNFSSLVSHLFNHQTHHRGQLTTVLTQLNIDIGTTDLLIEIPQL
mgnify:CR=1 FL=1